MSHFEKCVNLRVQIRFEPKIGLKKSDFEVKVLQTSTTNQIILNSYFGKAVIESTEYMYQFVQ